jgi:hypothetical protein
MGDDVILGGSNTDVIVGNGGNDWIGGGAGSDILAAGSGDVASSGSNPDNIFGNVGSTYESTIVAGTGNDARPEPFPESGFGLLIYPLPGHALTANLDG